MNVFEVVKENVTARQAAEAYGLKVGRTGMACCPFHSDKSPSMKLDERYYCFGCGATGDAVDLTAKLFGIGLREAAVKLAEDEMKLTDESWISYQQGKGNEEYQKYMEDLTDMQNHVLPYLQSFCSLEEKGVKEKREQQVAEKNESREAVPRSGVDENTGVKDAGKAERKAVAQKKAMPGKEKKPSIHERLEINKRIIQEKQGKDKPERGADLGVR